MTKQFLRWRSNLDIRREGEELQARMRAQAAGPLAKLAASKPGRENSLRQAEALAAIGTSRPPEADGAEAKKRPPRHPLIRWLRVVLSGRYGQSR